MCGTHLELMNVPSHDPCPPHAQGFGFKTSNPYPYGLSTPIILNPKTLSTQTSDILPTHRRLSMSSIAARLLRATLRCFICKHHIPPSILIQSHKGEQRVDPPRVTLTNPMICKKEALATITVMHIPYLVVDDVSVVHAPLLVLNRAVGLAIAQVHGELG